MDTASRPPSPPRRRPTDLPPLGEGEVDYAPREDFEIETSKERLMVGESTSPLVGSALSDIPLAQLYELNQVALDESVPEVALVGGVEPMDVLRAEYEKGSATFVKQIDWLMSKGYQSVRRARGDGNCFYRSVGFAWIEQLMDSDDKDMAVGGALSVLELTRLMLTRPEAGNESWVVEEFYPPVEGVIRSIVADQERLTPIVLLNSFQDPTESNTIVMYLRMVTAAQLKLNPKDFEDITFDENRLVSINEFCDRFVIPLEKEADHIQITALCQALKLNIDVAYLDGHPRQGDPVNFVELRWAEDDVRPLTLLYRPGHYDILIKA